VQTSRRILVVRLGAMGDIVHTLPAVAWLKQSHPDSPLTWLVEPRWAPLLEENPYVAWWKHAASFAPRPTISRWIFRGC
jgi:hypothetical protein